jgi:hypothetical protein
MARIIPTATAGGGPVGRGYQGMMAGCSRDRHCGRGRSGDRRAGVCGKRSDCTEPTLNQVRSCFSAQLLPQPVLADLPRAMRRRTV